MAVSSDRVLAPRGRLDPAVLWPGVTAKVYEDWIDTWAKDGKDRSVAAGVTNSAAAPTAVDDATLLWVYYRAFDAKALEGAALPASVSDPIDGAHAYSQGQLDSWRVLADAALAEWADAVAVTEVVDVPPPLNTTRSVPLVQVW